MFEIKKKERNIDTYDDILCNTSSHIYIYIFMQKKNALTAGGRKTIECLTFSRVRHMY